MTQNIIPKVIDDGTAQSRRGNCDFCKSNNVITIDPSSLSQWFEMLCDCYTHFDDGDSLVSLLTQDWCLFDHADMDEAHAKELLAEILDDGEIVRRGFAPNAVMRNETPQRWDDLRSEMMHANRWFLKKPVDFELLASLLEQLSADEGVLNEITDVWYRSRLASGDTSYPIDEMGAPSKELAGHGRANPAGIPYLYLGSTDITAMSEVRPHTGQTACIATFEVDPVKVIDLRNPRKSVSPFILSDAEQIASLRAGLPLLERLGHELTKPVHPSSAAYEYIPSQYLCEFIKDRGFDGVLYRSSVSSGVNMALFDPSLATAKEVKQHVVDKVTVEISELPPTEST